MNLSINTKLNFFVALIMVFSLSGCYKSKVDHAEKDDDVILDQYASADENFRNVFEDSADEICAQYKQVINLYYSQSI